MMQSALNMSQSTAGKRFVPMFPMCIRSRSSLDTKKPMMGCIKYRRSASSAARPKPCVIKALIAADRDTIDDAGQDRLDRLMGVFTANDTNKNGVLERDELRNLLEKVGDGRESVPMQWITEEDLNAVFDRYDTNHDGVISFVEYQAMSMDNIFLSGALADYKEAFAAFDTDKNGRIGPTEIFQMFERLESKLTYEEVCTIFEKYDVDKSGQIEFGEFLRMFRDQLIDLKEILVFISTPDHSIDDDDDTVDVGRSATVTLGEVTTFFTEKEFQNLIADNANRLVVIMASLTWCKPCKKFNPELEKFAKHYNTSLFVKFFGNSNEETKSVFKQTLKARVTPSFYFFRNGEIVGSCTGANVNRFEDNMRQHLRPSELPASRLYEQ